MPISDSREEALRLVATLSDREKHILARLIRGESTRAIAKFLSISQEETERAKRLLMEKVSAKTSADAVRIGLYAMIGVPR